MEKILRPIRAGIEAALVAMAGWRWFGWRDRYAANWNGFTLWVLECYDAVRYFVLFQREIQWKVGYDYRNDPNPTMRQYGQHGMEIRWLLHGPKATIQFLLMTPWVPTLERFTSFDQDNWYRTQFGVLPAELGYHADAPQYADQTFMDHCDVRPPEGGCFYDGSGLQADAIFNVLIKNGEEAVWTYMLAYYEARFGRCAKSGE